jgi:glycosyltransferase involved in cell wall biosynthesis
MHKNINISVVIPVFNREKMIEDCIQSAINQTLKPSEIIVVDNNSTDNTYSLLKYLSKKNKLLKIYKNNENIGPVRNWITAVEYAENEFVKILFSDDQMTSTFLEKTSKFLSDNVAFVSTSAYVGKSICESAIKYKMGSELVNKIIGSEYIKYSLSEPGILVSPGAALFRKNDILSSLKKSLIKYERGLTYRYTGAGPDLEIFLNSALIYENIIHINEPLAFFREHNNSATIIGRAFRKYPIKESYSQTKILFANYSINYLDSYYVSVRCFTRDLLSCLFEGGFNNLKTLKVAMYKPHQTKNSSKKYFFTLFYIFIEIFSIIKLKYYGR